MPSNCEKKEIFITIQSALQIAEIGDLVQLDSVVFAKESLNEISSFFPYGVFLIVVIIALTTVGCVSEHTELLGRHASLQGTGRLENTQWKLHKFFL